MTNNSCLPEATFLRHCVFEHRDLGKQVLEVAKVGNTNTLYPVPCTLFPISYILYPVSCTLYPIPYILYPVSCILYSVSCILYPVSCILYPVSCTCGL